ncbi:sirohydrochlorin chelatase [Paenibacillus sp. FSL W7-1287]|uniref:sirohydrochlorin chelatase n=1 Tax=Paenibacillus sp. FSL W7-1287 TaxID=2954538 RepID=UPI0030F6AEA1
MMNMKHGILVISHGSREQSWVKAVDEAVEAARQQWLANASDEAERASRSIIPVYSSYLELVEGHLIQDGIDKLEQEGVTHIHVMPLFVSSGSSHVDEIKQAFGFEPACDFIGDLEPFRFGAHISFDEPIGVEPEVVRILQKQIEEQLNPEHEEAVLLLGHGSSMTYFYEKWEAGMQQLAAVLGDKLNVQKVAYAPLLPDGSRAALVELKQITPHVIVIPLFISPGYFTRHVIPARLDGLDYTYKGSTLLPHSEMSKLLCRRFESYALDKECTQ